MLRLGHFIKLMLLVFLLVSPVRMALAGELSTDAVTLFKKYSPAIYQIQSISSQSNKKHSLGSGFQISAEGYVVTNYHVVSDAVMFPGSFHIRTVSHEGRDRAAQVVGFDVIHDLALLKVKDPQKIELPLGSSEINKGQRLFSIGNPEDVGMMIIEGVANGYMDKALYKKVLTSLPLNPGMSGGPALDDQGNVVGINVMTAGNSLSFLVPVECLQSLWAKTQAEKAQSLADGLAGVNGKAVLADNFAGRIQQQLIDQENSYIRKVIGRKWEKQRFGNFLVPAAIADEVSCWGAPRNDIEYWIERPYLECAIKDDLFISSSVRAHTVLLNYSLLSSRGYEPFRFYTLAGERFSKGYHFDLSEVFERDVDNFRCRTDIVKVGENPFWVSTCARRLKQLTRLYDINVLMASLGEMDTMLMVELTLGAVTKDTAKAFMDKFYKELEWAE
ncbi:MAG: trypsin-like peptidase domain-containing protein [Candidatus Omnitrophica bacterium]|nr:trypsin-like peptidase domain-containing protein [Candidatus Omnitrophota bacterium]